MSNSSSNAIEEDAALTDDHYTTIPPLMFSNSSLDDKTPVSFHPHVVDGVMSESGGSESEISQTEKGALHVKMSRQVMDANFIH